MTRFVLLLAFLSASCFATDVFKVSFLGANEISIEKSEIAKVRKFGTAGGQITAVTLRGLPDTGQVTVGDPRRGPLMLHINPIKASCGSGSKISAAGLLKVDTGESFFRDYVGHEGLDASWKYWLAFTPSFCEPGRRNDYNPSTDAYFICAGQPSQFRCVREHARSDYSAFFFIDSRRIGDWKRLDSEIDAYLSRVAKPVESDQ